MRSTLKWGRGGLVALVAGAAAALAVPAMGKNLYIDFSDGQDRICYGKCDAEGSSVQKLTTVSNSNCELVIEGPVDSNPNDLIDFKFTGGAAIGFDARKNFIGLKQNSGGTPCGRLGAPDQTLTLALGTEIPAGAGVYRATLSFDNRSDVSIDINTNGAMGTNYTVLAGKFRTGAPSTGPLLPGETFNCPNTRACLVDLRGPVWTSITFGAPEGVAGNAGDWALGGANNIELFLADGVLACGDEAEEPPEGVTLRRLWDVQENENLATCETRIPYSLSFDGTTLNFFADYSVLDANGDGEPDVDPVFEWSTIFPPTALEILDADFPAPVGNGFDDPALVLAYEDRIPLSWQQFELTDPVYTVDLCLGSPVYESTNVPVLDDNSNLSHYEQELVGLKLFPELDNDTENYDRYDMSDGLHGIQYGCFLERKINVLEAEQCGATGEEICVELSEKGIVRGDWTKTTNFGSTR